MCCTSSGNNCSCGCSNYTLESIAGPTGPQGPAGTTILVWDTANYSTATTASDVLLTSYTIPANTITSNGSELQFEITGEFSNNSDRAVKIDVNVSSLTTVVSNVGALADGRFVINGVITRVSNTTTEGFNLAHWNLGGTTQLTPETNTFTTDFTASQSFRVYVNQSVASSITIKSVKIRKAIL
jgi:enamine deaminase RidA (YjgF/YER057c/UK114 family)